MSEHTYRGLTLEFLSSYDYDVAQGLITFRLFGVDSELTLEQFGTFLGCRYDGDIHPPRDGEAVLWKALTFRDDFNSPIYKFKAHLIHHPVLRLWCRYVSSIYFARPESTNLKGCEIAMLFSLLNLDSGKPFTVNVAHHIASHFGSVVSGPIKPIMMGGLVTLIAKKVYPGFDESVWEKLPGSPPSTPLSFDEAYLDQLHYIKRVSGFNARYPRWNWMLQKHVLCRLPMEGPILPFKKVVAFKRKRNAFIDNTYYTIPHLQAQTDRSGEQPAGSGGDSDEEQELRGVRLIPPTGDYERFIHKPFDMGTYAPSFLGDHPFPPTFAAPPPFAPPSGWNQDSRDSILWGAVNQQHQTNVNLLLGQHNLLSQRYDEGFFPENTVHPAHFTPQGPPAQQPWDRQAWSPADGGASFRHSSANASGSGSTARRNSSYTGPVDSLFDPFGGF